MTEHEAYDILVKKSLLEVAKVPEDYSSESSSQRAVVFAILALAQAVQDLPRRFSIYRNYRDPIDKRVV